MANIEAARNKRLMNEKLKGATLGDIYDEVEGNSLKSASEWVKRSRNIEKTAPVAPVSKTPSTSTASYSSSDLQGLKVMHDIDALENGQEIILTLSGSSILERDDRGRILGLNSNDDSLENVNLAQELKRKDVEEKIKRSKLPVYVAYDDDEFVGGGKKRSILPQYDKEEIHGPSFTLEVSEHTGTSLKSLANTDPMESSKDSGNQSKSKISLSTEWKKADDFYSQEEYDAVSIKKSNRNKKRKLRRKEDEEDEEDNNNNNNMMDRKDSGSGSSKTKKFKESSEDDSFGAALLQKAFQNTNDPTGSSLSGNQKDGAIDRGSRNSRVDSRNHALVQEEQRRQANYRHALSVEQEKTRRAFALPNSASRLAADEESKLEEAQIRDTMARAQRLAGMLKLEKKDEMAAADNESSIKLEGDRGAQAILSRYAKNSSNESTSSTFLGSEQSTNQYLEEVDVDGKRMDGKLVFTSTVEFSTRLQAQLNERARSKAEALTRVEDEIEVFNEEGDYVDHAAEVSKKKSHQKEQKQSIRSSIVDVDDKFGQEDGRKHGEWTTIGDSSRIDESTLHDWKNNNKESEFGYQNNHDGDEDDNEDDEEDENDNGAVEDDENMVDFLHRQPLASQGMAAALSLLKDSGDLKRNELVHGRAKDARNSQLTAGASTDNSEIRLEYRNKLGQKLTPKEAFRQLCYSFHGYGPSKKTIEKRLKVGWLVDVSISISLSLYLSIIYIYFNISMYYRNLIVLRI